MKNVAILAVILGLLSSTANAESAVSEAPLTLALNSTTAVTWAEPVMTINSKTLANNIELKLNESMEQISIALDKQLEDKITKELEYAMH